MTDLGRRLAGGDGPVTAPGLALPLAGSLAWLAVSSAAFWFRRSGDGVDPVLALLAVGLVIGPIGAIWGWWGMWRQARETRFELARLRLSVLRGSDADLDARLAKLEAAQKTSGMITSQAMPDKRRDPTPPGQRSLGLSPGPSAEPLTGEELAGALDFPADPNDRAGFALLKRASHDPEVGRLMMAAEDILTLLSQDGLYMDDLDLSVPDASVLRRFSAGDRGAGVGSLGEAAGDGDDELAMRMRADPVFRDAAHHFVRLFDRMMTAREPGLSDGELIAIADSRSGRAFRLIGRALGSFEQGPAETPRTDPGAA